MQSKWDERMVFYDPQPSRQAIERDIPRVQAIDSVLEDAYTSFCIRLRSGKYDQESAFKTSIHDYVETYVQDNYWLYRDDPETDEEI